MWGSWATNRRCWLCSSQLEESLDILQAERFRGGEAEEGKLRSMQQEIDAVSLYKDLFFPRLEEAIKKREQELITLVPSRASTLPVEDTDNGSGNSNDEQGIWQ